MNDITQVVKISKADLQSRLNTNSNFNDVTGGVIVGIAGWIAEKILKKSPIGSTLLFLQAVVEGDSYLISQKMKYMAQNGYTYFVITSTYKYVGYMPGSSYPTYSLKTQTYSYQ